MFERHLMLLHINPFKASKFIVLSQLQPKHRRSQTDPTYYSSQCEELQSHLDSAETYRSHSGPTVRISFS